MVLVDFSTKCSVVVVVLVALVVNLTGVDGGQWVQHLMNCHRSGEDLGRSRSYLIPLDTAAGLLANATDDRNDRRPKMVMIRITKL